MIALRDLRRGDAAPCARAFVDDPGLAARIGIDAPLRRRDVRHLVAREGRDRADGRAWRLAIADAEDAFAGLILLHTFRGRRADCGFFVVPAARGRGVAGAALGLLLECAFDRLHLERVHLRTRQDNLPARRLAERAGFVCEGVDCGNVSYGAGAPAWA